jgi:hypothetical protein
MTLVFEMPTSSGKVQALSLPALWFYENVGDPLSCQPSLRLNGSKY